MICFVVPIQSLARARDPGCLKRVLHRTVLSVLNQTDPEWRMVLVADDPPSALAVDDLVADPRIRWEVVGFPYDAPVPPGHRHTGHPEAFLRGERDKGRKTLWGCRLAQQDGVTHIMSLDCDDLVSCRLAGWCRANPDASGWWFESGWVWAERVPWLVERIRRRFNCICGSSHIVNARFFGAGVCAKSFTDPDIDECGWWLPHAYIRPRLSAAASDFSRLPFRGAMYVRHGTNTSRPLSGVLKASAKMLLRGRPFSRRIREEFLGRNGNG